MVRYVSCVHDLDVYFCKLNAKNAMQCSPNYVHTVLCYQLFYKQ